MSSFFSLRIDPSFILYRRFNDNVILLIFPFLLTNGAPYVVYLFLVAEHFNRIEIHVNQRMFHIETKTSTP